MHNQKRREFFRNVALIVPALAVMPSSLFSKNVCKGLRIGFIGTGIWGRLYLSAALTQKDLTITAICDADKASLQEGLQLFKGFHRPLVFDSWQQLLASDEVDVVIIATPAHTHYTIAKAAMLAGKHVACGPVMGETVEEHKDIVKTSQQTGRHYFTLDEQSYRHDLQAIADVDFGTLDQVIAGAPYDVLPPQADTYPLYPSLFLQGLLGPGNQIKTVAATTKQMDYVVHKVNPKTGKHKMLVKKGEIPLICLTTTNGQQVYLQTEKGYTTGTHIHGTGGSWIDYTRSMRMSDNQWEEDQLHLQQHAASPVASALNELFKILKSSVPQQSVHTAANSSLIALLGRQSATQGGKIFAFPDYRLI
ncbi:Gfo/Idh/MocA family protein [Chitinophaga silvisoli]|uniref:Gfo/Idh/MocA family oxidoreductase n=1 Tax=Chitinophaga silvisoli TaxID=2291814 RepID=A0A3E1NW16_9BACT|nr:Gfo/Idh/MocA family oxidoreductase [Chitinophaga silvisoli]RFM32141.1 gfo/Idh/MocA family oxidoreductase [Chitinophaga silvisoli]